MKVSRRGTALGAAILGISLAFFISQGAGAADELVVLRFEDVTVNTAAQVWQTLPQDYGGLHWDGGELAVANAEAAEFFFPFVASSGRQALFGGGDADVQVRPRNGRFDFLGARFRVWGEAAAGTVSFSGWVGDEKRHQAGPFVIDREFRAIPLRWPGLDRVTIQGSGHYLMDDFRYRPAPAPAPPESPRQEALGSVAQSK